MANVVQDPKQRPQAVLGDFSKPNPLVTFKPDPEIFRRVLDVMNVNARSCLHVGDDPENDWAGAAAAGMAVFRVNRPDVTLDHLNARSELEARRIS